MNVSHYYDVAKNVATFAIGFSNRTVQACISRFQRYITFHVSFNSLTFLTLFRLHHFGVIAFTAVKESVHVYVLKKDTAWFEKAEKKIEFVKRKFKNLKVIPVFSEIELITHVYPGDYITIPKQSEEKCQGTLGIFGKRRSGSHVALTGAHVIEEGELAQISTNSDRLCSLGRCIYSPRKRDSLIVNIKDIGVIEIDKDILETCVVKMERNGADVIIFDRNHPGMNLHRRRVFKIGGTTGETVGFIEKAEYSFTIADDTVDVILIEENNKQHFCKPGDSGAIVFTKRGTTYVAIAVVFGGALTLPDVPENTGIAVSLSDAIMRFNLKMGDNLSIQRF